MTRDVDERFGQSTECISAATMTPAAQSPTPSMRRHLVRTIAALNRHTAVVWPSQSASASWKERPVAVPEHRIALEPVVGIFQDAGIYAYRTLDAENNWCVAVDIEEGHIDVRIGDDGYELDVWATSPGLFIEEENQRRRHALERLARISLPGIRRGFLEENQTIEWSDHEHGLALRSRFILPFSRDRQLPAVALEQLTDLNRTLTFIERRIAE
jgi:hypothetical protein